MLPAFGQMVRRILLVNTIFLGTASSAMCAENAPPIRIVALGDSLTAGYGLKQGEGFPEQLSRLLKSKGHNVVVSNAGVSGDTTAGGLERLDWSIGDDTEAVIMELGANDALRGLPVDQARRNLETMIKRLKSRGIPVLLAGMRAPRNLGDDYANAFDRMYPELAEKYDLILYPFFLTGVALDPKLNLGDGLHPTANGVGIIAERILPDVEALIEKAKARRQLTPQPSRG